MIPCGIKTEGFDKEAASLTIQIDGTPIPLDPLVAAMVLLLVDNQQSIIKQGFGQVHLDYAPKNVVFSLLKKSYSAAGRKV